MSNFPLKPERRRYTVSGIVQGVGFRAFIYRLATEHNLRGWVQNTSAGVTFEIEGDTKNITAFEAALPQQKPARAIIDRYEFIVIALQNDSGFRIVASDESEDISVSILPDISLCSDCLSEMSDQQNRRYHYPFINCVNCGPRYTIITALPYDRSATSMAGFEMCSDCRSEYEDPTNRRFHAQPIACPKCGPHLELWDEKGEIVSIGDEAIKRAAAAIVDGKIIALKGLGGFHLIADASNEEAVQLLRNRKARKTKPFALMYPTLENAQADCFISTEEKSLLCSAAAPIVLLRHKNPAHIAPSVAPRNPYFGVMLPYTPLHVLLLQNLQRPVVATSGNRASEPICIAENEALECLGGIADLFLVHNRSIINRCDDSITRIIAERAMIIRRARGYAPLAIRMRKHAAQTILAVGGHLKNTIALAKGNRLTLSPHIGDLDTPEACAAHEEAISTMINLYHEKPELVGCDAHPDYRSTQLVQGRFTKTIPVQHHYAHALSCMIDNQIEAPCFAAVWDGAGLGDDGTIWGGEFLNITENGYKRTAHLLSFPLPGGEQAARKPTRSALGVLYAMQASLDSLVLADEEKRLLIKAIERKINTSMTSSAGRLFDAVASLCGLCHENTFEGEAAMALEFTAVANDAIYDFELSGDIVDWRPMMRQILIDLENKTAVGIIAARFHNTLASIIAAVAQRQPSKQILLTGGCFQNKLLLESAIKCLNKAGFEPFYHQQIPPNDGGLAAGQIAAILRNKSERK